MAKMSSEDKNISAPVASHERIELIDVLRGFAVFGILVANMVSFSGQPPGPGAWYQVADKIIYILTRFLVEAKFYSLFSFLFGWGMAVQIIRAQSKGKAFLPRYMRRLLVLLLFGAIHGTLIWTGDILTLYAMLGFLLLLFRNRSPRFLLTASVSFLIASILLTLPLEAVQDFRTWYADITYYFRQLQFPDGLYLTGSYLEVTRRRIQEYLAHNSNFIFSFGNVFGMFLLGLAAGKFGFFQNIERYLPRVRKGIWIALTVGLLFNAVFVSATLWPNRFPADYWQTIRVGARTIGAPGLMLFYIAAIVLLSQNKRWRQRLIRLAPVGRTALSNYLFQSVLSTMIFYGYGLGFYGRIDPTTGLILTLLIYLLQIGLSAWWLDRYRFGPVEWLWRTLTYGYAQPLMNRWSFEKEKPSRETRLSGGRARTLALASGGLILLLWAGGLILWSRSLQSERVQPSVFYASLPRREGIAVEEEQDLGVSQEPEIRATPVVTPVPYLPGDVAASGDLVAMAFTVDVDRAFQQIQILTGPPYLGRLAGSIEGWRTAEYIAGQFADVGLQPAGEDGGFFQPFPVPYEPLASLPKLEVYSNGDLLMDFVLHEDYNVRSKNYSGEGSFEADVVWVNNCEQSDFNDVTVEDKIAFCWQVPEVDADRNAIEHGAQGLLLLVDPAQRSLDFAYSRQESIVPHPIPTFLVAPNVAEVLLSGSGLSLQDISLAFRSRPLATSARLEVDQAGPEGCISLGCEGRNVLGVLPGRDPAVAHEVVILSAHYDHMGQAPDGTVWPGANDDASGVAALLEIARSWHEQGYVPRRTVLFAAWDGEELGLLGSRAYTQRPSYPLNQTRAVIQLDMIGGGGEVVQVDGWGGIEAQITAAADLIGLDAVVTEVGRSDHFPFLQVGVPANMIGWLDTEGQYRDYHRPIDTPERIDLDKLDQSMKVTNLTLLGLVEGEPTIRELLAQRAAALMESDLGRFLATSHPDQRDQDQYWFDDAQRLNPLEFDLDIESILIQGDRADTIVKMRFLYAPDGDSSENGILLANLAVRILRTADGWRWAGSDMMPVDIYPGADATSSRLAGVNLNVSIPEGEEIDIADLLQRPMSYMQDTGRQLGLALPQDLSIELYRNSSELALSTLPSLGRNRAAWVSEGIIKLVLDDVIEAPALLEDALVRVLLTEAGVDEEILPWLWEGLPILIRAEADPTGIQPLYLPRLSRALFADGYIQGLTASWASVDYLQALKGWYGLGRWIRTLGRACATSNCENADVLQAEIQNTLGMDNAEFEDAWKAYWTDELGRVAEDMEAMLSIRSQAIEDGDEAVFLSTVDPTVPFLVAEQGSYFSFAMEVSDAKISFEWEPLALLEDGSLLAAIYVVQETMVDGSTPRIARSSSRIHFSPTASGYRWAGAYFESMGRGRVRVFYPPDLEDLAGQVLEYTESAYAEIRRALSLQAYPQLTVKLYDVESRFWGSIWPGSGTDEDQHYRTAADQSLKLLASALDLDEAFQTQLTESILRHILTQSGLESEWLLRGMSLALVAELDGGERSSLAMRQLLRLPSKLERDQLGLLLEMSDAEELDEEAQQLADAQAWDSVNYLLENYGGDHLSEFFQLLATGNDEAAAFQEAFGLDQGAFDEEWRQSILRGHLPVGMERFAEGFDSERAFAHVQMLAGPEFGGRGAGSAGAQAAVEYIAESFEAYGLIPITPIEREASAEDQGDESTEALNGQDEFGYLQKFPIYSIQLERQPSLRILDQDGEILADYHYREHFQTIPQAYPYSGPVTGELIWTREEEYSDLDLSGKIVLRDVTGSLADEIEQAVASGALGLVVVTDIRGGKPFLNKDALPLSEPEVVNLPVLHLERNAFEDLLKIAGETLVSVKRSPPALPLGVQVLIDLPYSPTSYVLDANVLGLLPGSDPTRADEIVILSAHYDHVGDDPDIWQCLPGVTPSEEAREAELCTVTPGLRFPGINDNATGIGVLLEVARVWQETGYQPVHSVLFAAWGAQESGEVGSRYYIDHPLFPLDKTRAMIQLDAIGGGTGYYLEAMGTVDQDGLLLSRVAIQDELAEVRLSLVMESAAEVKRLSRLPPEWIEWPSREDAFQSDQIPFMEQGVPSLLLRWRKADETNSPGDFMDEVLLERLGAAGRTVILLTMSLAR
ncbi:MAG: M28 family peptidase [Anaerolineales bacterium]